MWQGAEQSAPTSFLCLNICMVMLNIANHIHLSYYSSYQGDSSISRRQFNDRRKKTAGLCEELRKRIAMEMDGGEA